MTAARKVKDINEIARGSSLVYEYLIKKLFPINSLKNREYLKKNSGANINNEENKILKFSLIK